MINFRFLLLCGILLLSYARIDASEYKDFSPKVDSLKAIINSNHPEEYDLVEASLALAWELKSVNPQDALKYALQGFNIAQSNNMVSHTAYALRIMGVIYWQSGDFTNAMDYQMESHAIYTQLDDKEGIGRTLSNLGLIFSDLGHYEKSLDYFFQAMVIHEKCGNKEFLAPVLNNIGLVYQYQGEYQLAEQYHMRSLEIKNETDDKKGIAFTMNNLGVISQRQGNYVLALEYFKRAMALRKETSDNRELAITLTDLGFLYLDIDSLSLAQEHLEQAKEIYIAVDDQSGLARCYNILGKVYIEMSELNKANQMLNNSMEISERIGLIRTVTQNYKTMSELMAARGNYSRAYDLQNRFIFLVDSISSYDSQRRMLEIQLIYEHERKDRELEIVKKTQQISSLSFEKQILQRNFLLAAIILVLALLFLLYNRYLSIIKTNKQLEIQKEKISETNQKLLLLNRDLMKQKQKVDELNLMLKETNQKLLESEKHLINTNRTKDKFFSIISHDLRNPFASIVSFSRILKREIHELSHDEINELALELDKSVLKINNLLENLLQWSRAQTGKIDYRPEYIALKDIINENINLFSGNSREKEIQIKDGIGDDLVVFADMNMTNTVVRNLLSNALKYTRIGGTIELSSSIDSGKVYVSVADNGVGINPENLKKLFRIDTLHTTFGTSDEKGSGLGLLLCKEFIEKQGGEISLESTEGEGTTFTFSLPLENPF